MPGWVTRSRQRRIWSNSRRETSTESQKLYLAVIVAAELGEGTDQAFEKLDAALKKQPQDSRPALRCRLCLRPGISGCCPEGPGKR